MSTTSKDLRTLKKSGYVSLPLSDKNTVLYSVDGSAKSIVLSGLALRVFKTLGLGITVSELRHWAEENDIKVEHFDELLSFFIKEGLLEPQKGNNLIKRSKGKKKKERSLGLWIHVADICNLDCDYCYVHKGNTVLEKEVASKLVSRVKSEAEKNPLGILRLKFAGGEPLLFFDRVLYLLDLAEKKLLPMGISVRPSIITNGTVVTPDIALVLKRRKFSVMVSLDGVEDFNASRHYPDGRSSYNDVIEGLEILIDADIKPTILTTISNNNVAGLGSLTELISELNLNLSLSLSRDYNEKEGLSLDLSLVEKHLMPLLSRLNSMPIESLPSISFNGLKFDGRKRKMCGGGHNYFGVTPHGGISFCQMTTNKPMVDLDSLQEGFLGLKGKYKYPDVTGDCSACLWKHVCCGGCEILAKQAGTLGKPSVFCALVKVLIPEILVLEGRKLIKRKEESNVYTKLVGSTR